jgi:hypothetical protein
MILTDEEIMDAAFQATTHLIDDVAEKRGQQAAKGIAIGILMALVEILDKDCGLARSARRGVSQGHCELRVSRKGEYDVMTYAEIKSAKGKSKAWKTRQERARHAFYSRRARKAWRNRRSG